MELFLSALTIIIGIKIIIVLYRVLRGPTVFDRLVGLQVIGTDVIVMLLFIGFFLKRVDMFVDISIAYGALGFIGFLILAKYFEGKGGMS